MSERRLRDPDELIDHEALYLDHAIQQGLERELTPLDLKGRARDYLLEPETRGRDPLWHQDDWPDLAKRG